MTTYNTGNPIGSTDARDRLDNSENMDILENSVTLNAHPDRLGVMRKTRKGMELEHDNQISAHELEHDNQMQSFETDFDGRLAGMAFTRVGSFTTGATLTDMRQVLIWEVSQGGDGHEYGWTGSFSPSGKVVIAGATPATSGGIGAGAWVDRTQETLRSELGSLESTVIISGVVASDIAHNNNIIDESSTNSDIELAIASGRYIAKKGEDIQTSGQLSNSYNRNNRMINGDYSFNFAGLKHQNYCFGTFESAAVASFIAKDSSVESGTQILGAQSGQDVAVYGNVDTAAVYIENSAQPSLLTASDTTFTATSVSSPSISSVADKVRKGMVVSSTDGGVISFGIVTNISGTTITTDGWHIKTSGLATTPSNGSTLKIQPTSRIWGENIIAVVTPESEASSAVCSEMMVNLTKIGSGDDTQICKAINNNLAGIVADCAFETVGLFDKGFRAKEGSNTGVLVENASTYGFRNVQNGTTYSSTISFLSEKASGAAYGADVSFDSRDGQIGIRILDATTRAIQVREGANERLQVRPNGVIYQVLGTAQNTLAAQFGITANAGLTVYQSAGEGAAYDATVRVGKLTTNNRSINTAGTVNTSGADYAEYMFKRDDCEVIKKGDICGIDENGMLTDKFSLSKHFCVKSTAPSFVGGDTWFNEDEPEDIESEAHAEWEVRKEEARCKVDRIAFCGIVPINIESAKSGDYVIPVCGDNDSITAITINNPTLEQYLISVGKMISSSMMLVKVV